MAQKFPEITDDPTTSKTIGIDFTRSIPDGETLDAVSWVSDPSGLVFTGSSISGAVASVSVSGGRAGVEYMIKAKPTYSGGDNDPLSAPLRVVKHKRL